MKAFVIKAGSTTLEGLQLTERDKPEAGPDQILVAMKAAAINFRDLIIPLGLYLDGPLAEDTIALSDGTGEVVEVGANVTRFKVGDRVSGTLFQNWIDGPLSTENRPSLGANTDGVLAEFAVFNENDAVHIPSNLSFAEAATLPCAGVTAWNALFEAGNSIKAGDTVLALGTGGVSVLSLQLAKAAGAQVVITSSSDEKLAKARALGADHTVNYKTHPEWEVEVLSATQNNGVDCVIEVGGVGTLSKSMTALAMAGKICMIGFVAGHEGSANPQQVMRTGGNLHGIFVGNRAMFERLNRCIEINDIHPVVDKVFAFEEAIESYAYLQSQAHFGKVVINIA